MWNMQHCMAHLLVVAEFQYLQKSVCGGAKTPFSYLKCLYFQSHLLSIKDIEHWRPPKDVSCQTAYFIYQALNYLINIGGHDWGNHLAKTRTELVASGFSWNQCSRNSPKTEQLLILVTKHLGSFFGNSHDCKLAGSWKKLHLNLLVPRRGTLSLIGFLSCYFTSFQSL